MTGTPIAAAAIGATPVSNPARPEPIDCTHEYQRMNATAVTATARYPIASTSPRSKVVAAETPSMRSARTANITAAIQVAWTDTPTGPCLPSTGTASSVNPASHANTVTAHASPIASARPKPSTTTAPALTTTAAANTRARGLRPSSSGPMAANATGTQATPTASTAGSAWRDPCTSATLNTTRPLTATPLNHSHSVPRGRRSVRPVARDHAISRAQATA